METHGWSFMSVGAGGAVDGIGKKGRGKGEKVVET